LSLKEPSDIPDYAIEALARCLFPAILKFYGSNEGQAEFERWREQNKEKQGDSNTNTT